MNIAFFIARRYILSRKQAHAINIISMISVLGIFIGTAALIVILSVFNGFRGIALSMYNSFSPDLKIEAREGKVFDPDLPVFQKIRQQSGVGRVVETLEEKALLVYHRHQYIAILRGFDSTYGQIHSLDTMILDGHMKLQQGSLDFAVLGAGVQYRLGVQTKAMEPMDVFSPARHMARHSGTEADFNRLELYPQGVFSIQQEYDDQYVLTSLRFMRSLLNEPRNVSSLDVYIKAGVKEQGRDESIRNAVEGMLPPAFKVRDRYQQNELLFKTLNSEKWAVFLILAFVLVIAIFNVMGSLTMLVIEKQKDIGILSSMGSPMITIRRIFLFQGLLISLTGALAGLVAGAAFCFAQQKLGFIRIGAGKSFVVDSYPVVMNPMDFVLVLFTVCCISFLASWMASGQAVRQNLRVIPE